MLFILGTLAKYSSLDKKAKSTIANPHRSDKQIDGHSYFGKLTIYFFFQNTEQRQQNKNLFKISGYSISAGKFNASNPDQIFYVSGAPRNKDLYGSVNIFL